MWHLFHAATLEDLMESPGALSVISSSQCTPVCQCQKGIVLHIVTLWEVASD